MITSFDSDDEDNVFDTSRVELITANHQSITFGQIGNRSAYDFDEVKAQEEELKYTRTMGMLPIPLPCIEPSTTKEIDETNDTMTSDLLILLVKVTQ